LFHQHQKKKLPQDIALCVVLKGITKEKGKEKRVVTCVIVAMLGYVLHLVSKYITQKKIFHNFINTSIVIIYVLKV